MKKTFAKKTVLVLALFCWGVPAFVIAQADPVVKYIVSSEIVAPWQAVIGNGLQYNIPVKGGLGETERGNLVVKPIENDDVKALHLKWKGKVVKTEWGGNALYDTYFSLTKHAIDISSVEGNAALTLRMRILKAPNKSTIIGMTCKYDNKNCKGEIELKHVLKKMPKKKWINVPLPLKCFNTEGKLDFTQVTDIVSIKTQGKLEIEISDIGLTAVDPASIKCAK